MYKTILKDFYLEDNNVISVFPYGSRVYGNNKPDSDYDFIVVCKRVNADSDRLDSINNPISITIYSEELFKKKT